MTTKETPDHQNVDGINFHSYGDGFIRLITDNGYLFDVTIPKKEPPAIDVAVIKRECIEYAKRDWREGAFGYNEGEIVVDTINHLASKYDFVPKGSCLREPLPRVDGLSDAIWVLEDPTDERNEYINKVLIAAKAYLKASEV